MPKSKKAKVVPLTKTKKKTRENKEGLISNVRDAVDQYTYAYVFRYENMRNNTLKELRETLHGSARFFLGSNKVLQVALGRTATDTYRDNLHQLAERLGGDTGLCFTNHPKEELEETFKEHEAPHFARVGTVATETVVVPAGPLVTPAGLSLPHTMEPFLRKHGLPCKLNKGVIEVLGEHTVCKQGEELDANGAAILKVFDHKMAKFKLELDSVWTNGEFTVLSDRPPPRKKGLAAAGFGLDGDDDGDFTFEEREVPSDGGDDDE